MNYEKNPLIFSKEDIFGSDEKLNNYKKFKTANTDDLDDNYNNVFVFGNLCMEYNFSTRETSIFKQLPDGNYQLLYEYEYNNGTHNYSLYTEDGVFILADRETDSGLVRNLHYVPIDIFVEFVNEFVNKANVSKKSFIDTKISQYLGQKYIYDNFTPLISNNEYYDTDSNKKLFATYRQVSIKYAQAAMLIPVSNILDEFISDIHTYIATGKIDFSTFQKKLVELQNFKDMCPNSIDSISSFLNSPSSADLQELCTSLGQNLKNVDNLIYLYMEDYITPKKKENNYDSK